MELNTKETAVYETAPVQESGGGEDTRMLPRRWIMTAYDRTPRYFPARPLSPAEEELVERGYRALLAGELRRYSVTYREGASMSTVGIDVRNESEARQIAEMMFGQRCQARGGTIAIELEDYPSGHFDHFRPGDLPFIGLVPRGFHVPGRSIWLEEHRSRQMELVL